MSYRYQPFYCEENAVALLDVSPVCDLDPWLLLISNVDRQVMMFAQSAAKDDGVVVWDYHAAVLTRADQQVWDLDSVAGFPLALDEYLSASFGPPGLLPPMWQPLFRLFSASTVKQSFSSDRSHMLDDEGNYRAPPPPWPPFLNGPSTLPQWIDMTQAGALTREELLTEAGS